MPTKRLSLLVALPLFALLAFSLSCGDNTSSPFLDPDADVILAEGLLSGTLDWGEVTENPETVVYVFKDYDPSCQATTASVHITGTYSGWDTGLWDTTPGMTQMFPCLWMETISLTSDDAFAWKFVTNRAWDGSYAGCDDCEIDEEARTGEVTPTNGDDIPAVIPLNDDYIFLLNASSDPAVYEILAEGDPVPWDTLGGELASFTFENLLPGLYTIVIDVPSDRVNFPTRFVRKVKVTGEAGVDLGIIQVVPKGFIRGTVAFEDDPAVRPEVTVLVRFSDTGGVVDTLTIGPDETTFTAEGLSDGAYDFVLSAPGYVTQVVEGTDFEAGDETDLAPITMLRAGNISGTVAFSEPPDPRPGVAAIAVRAEGDTLTVFADPVDGSFLMTDFAPGTYFVAFVSSSAGFRDTLISDIVVTAGATTDIGTVTLEAVAGYESEYDVIRIVGDVTNWSTDRPSMTEIEGGVWVDTLEVATQICTFLKFRTAEDWGANDYGSCTSENLSCSDPLTGVVCLGEGSNEAPALGQFDLDPGTYEVKLDEVNRTYAIRDIGKGGD
ncbi:MAG: carboxypeptidase regulatory-like domain-containing protein [Gemmatimonadetes bacterium]|nr:carboxypeptidase regulatory-like domain-containing protein [Gemmatimonadota bacterium]